MHGRWLRLLVCLVILRPFGALGIGAGVGVAADTSHWEVRASELQCTLWHEVPDFGVMRFWHAAGEGLYFGARALDAEAWQGAAELVVSGAPWAPAVPRTLGALAAGRINARLAREALSALDAGRALRLVVSTPSGVRTAEASPAAARAPLEAFRRCEQALYPHAFTDMERSVVHYEVGDGQRLTEEARARLDEVAGYLTVDASVETVYVDGHTDSVGKHKDNLELSEQRARTVAAYLRAHGVPESKIVVRYHADRYPVASNDTPAGRARNRRATVRLSREPPPEPVLAASASPAPSGDAGTKPVE